MVSSYSQTAEQALSRDHTLNISGYANYSLQMCPFISMKHLLIHKQGSWGIYLHLMDALMACINPSSPCQVHLPELSHLRLG